MSVMSGKRKRDSQEMHELRSPTGLGHDSSEFEQQYDMYNPVESHLGEGHSDLDFAVLVNHASHSIMPETDEKQIQQQPATPQQPSNQRPHAHGGGQSASDTATAALAQFHTMRVPQSTENTFMNQATEQGGDRVSATPGEGSTQQRTSSFGGDIDASTAGNGDASPDGTQATPSGGKPSVGSEEWHKVRRDNHKEVERRRRETINEGINELAKIVPGCEKNKGSILARAVQFITQLKENETQNIEKWTLEKLLTEQAIAELSSSCDKLKAECQRAWAESEQWKKEAQKLGASVDADAKASGDDDDAE